MAKILLVEDNEMNRDMLSRRLVRKGYEIVIAEDGQKAVDMACSEEPDIILMDMSLPVIDGWEATRRVKAGSCTGHIPIIALTAHAMASDRDKAIEAGCDEYETKPVDLPKLLEKIQLFLEMKAGHAELEVHVAELMEDDAVPEAAQEVTSVLLVDDNDINLDLLSRRVMKEGHEVTLARNGMEALKQLKSRRFSLVLLDIMMPLLNGYEVLEQMKADDALKSIPVIMISAVDDIDSIVRCIEMGAEDYLTKPFNPVLLRARMNASLEKKRLRDKEDIYLHQIEAERKRADTLLRVILPEPVVEELKRTNVYRPRRYEDVAVLFCDIVGFTAYCDQLQPEVVVPHLQEMVEEFEDIAVKNHLQKIKTIGDSFMAAAGILKETDNPVLDCIRCGLDMVAATNKFPSGWQVRIGVHCGPVMAGVVGRRQYLFDIWGDTVNTASRVERHGKPGAVCISEVAMNRVVESCSCENMGLVKMKGKGDFEVYTVNICSG